MTWTLGCELQHGCSRKDLPSTRWLGHPSASAAILKTLNHFVKHLLGLQWLTRKIRNVVSLTVQFGGLLLNSHFELLVCSLELFSYNPTAL